MSKTYGFMRRAIAFAGAVIITVNIAAAPQRARAVAITASVVASVAAIMTAAGVTYWAATQQDAIDYIGGKIDSYLASLETVPVSYEDWLGINAPSELFTVTAEGAMRFGAGVANKISAFVSSLFAEEGIESGGNAVDIGGGGREFYASEYSMPDFPYTHNFIARAINATDIHVMFSASRPNDGYSPQWQMLVPVEHSAVTVSVVSGSNTAGSWGAYAVNAETSLRADKKAFTTGMQINITDDSKDYILLCFVARPARSDADNQIYGGGEGTIRITSAEDIYTPPSNTITPGEAVAVQGELAENDYLDVAPSVPLSSGMSVETASDAVLVGVASEDGLTAEGDAVEGAAVSWGWLADLLERIRQAVQGTQEHTAPAEYQAIDSYSLDLTSFFPFCLPWDIHRGLSLLVADPVAPSIDWEVPLPNGSTYELQLDLSDWDGVAQVARTMELLAFVVALAVATKKLIKW